MNYDVLSVSRATGKALMYLSVDVSKDVAEQVIRDPHPFCRREMVPTGTVRIGDVVEAKDDDGWPE